MVGLRTWHTLSGAATPVHPCAPQSSRPQAPRARRTVPGRTTVVGAARPVSRAVLVHSKLFDLNQFKLQVYEIRRIEAKLPLRRPI